MLFATTGGSDIGVPCSTGREDRAVGRRDEGDLAARAGQHQPVAGEHRAAPEDRILARPYPDRSGPAVGLAAPFRAAKGGELRNPADPARGARDRQHLRPIGDHEHPVARDPGRRDAGDVQFPGALAGDQLDRDHAAALADREDAAIVDHRIGVDVGKRADDGRDAGPRQRVLPDHLAVLVAIGGELARRDSRRRASICAKAGAALPNTPASSNEPDAAPAGLAVLGVERVELAVLAKARRRCRRRSSARRAAGRPASPSRAGCRSPRRAPPRRRRRWSRRSGRRHS